MMLPPLNSLPREGLVVFMAAEACLTARKQLVIGQRTEQANAEGTHESAFTRMTSMNCSGVMSQSGVAVAMPALAKKTSSRPSS